LFGNNASTANGGGLFGNAQQPQQQSSGNLFGKSTGGLFGGQQSTSGTSNIFGAQANTGLAGSSGFGNGIGSSSLFGAQQSQAGLQPSISSSAYGNNPLFASVQANPTSSPGPLATPLVSNTVKKKPATLPRFNLTPRSNASSPRLLSNVKQTLSKSPIANARKSGLSLFDEDLLMNPDAFSPRSNIKRLVIDRKADDQELLSGGLDLKGIREGPPTAGESAKPLVESARTLVPTRQKDFGLTTSGEPNQLPSVSDGQSMSQANSAPSSQTVSNVGSTSQDKTSRDTVAVSQKDHDAYWTSPPTSVLMDLSKAELSKVSNFTVGRRGYGQVSFNSAVDLSSLEQVEDVAGKIIIFEPKMCTVYPDEELKPSVGKGLNVPATITLEQCFPLSKDKRQPIRDKTHPRFQQHVDRLKRMSETEFVDYLAESGTWIFKVEHF
jgi:nuclear pore complex protein Nup98-Nup96